MKYRVTARFSGFAPGEIVEIPKDNDLPKSLFDQGFFVPLEEPKKAPKKMEEPKITPSTTETIGTKSDKIN